MGEAIRHDVKPESELVVAARPDLDPRRGRSLGLAHESEAEHVLKRHEPIASVGQEGADRGVGEVGKLDLHGGAAGGKGALDLVQRGHARHTAEAEPRDLVERRALLGEGRHAAGNRDHEARRAYLATIRGLAGAGDELRLDALDALGQGGVAEERRSVKVHAQNLAPKLVREPNTLQLPLDGRRFDPRAPRALHDLADHTRDCASAHRHQQLPPSPLPLLLSERTDTLCGRPSRTPHRPEEDRGGRPMRRSS
jgi:hypothetical protein